MNYTYLLLHPSSSRFVEKILEEILYNGFQIFGIYRVDEWYKDTEEIYKNSYIKSRTVRQHVIAQAFINLTLFGSCGMLIVLSKKNKLDLELVKDTLALKVKIRNFLYERTNDIMKIYIDISKIENIEKKENENNYEKIFLSFIHCPDTIEQYKQDFLFFKDSIMKKGKLDEKDIKTMKAYQTFLI